ncbi:MAG: hypothetical protein AAFV93_11005 [Chloroflexota bacterium]
MKAFNDLNLQELHWVEANSLTSRQELRNEQDEVIATIEKEKWWKGTYLVDAPGNRWVFEPKGILSRRIEIYSAGTGDLMTTFHYRGMTSGGRLTLPDGRTFRWKSLSFWGNKWAWLEGEDGDDDPVIGFDTGGFFRARADLTFDEDADFPALLVFLGWYLHRIYRQQQAAG